MTLVVARPPVNNAQPISVAGKWKRICGASDSIDKATRTALLQIKETSIKHIFTPDELYWGRGYWQRVTSVTIMTAACENGGCTAYNSGFVEIGSLTKKRKEKKGEHLPTWLNLSISFVSGCCRLNEVFAVRALGYLGSVLVFYQLSLSRRVNPGADKDGSDGERRE